MIDRADWNAPWFDRGAWIMDHLEQFSLTPDETLVVLIINYLDSYNQLVTPDAISAKTGLDAERVDQALETLSARGYLTVEMKNKKLAFVLEGLMDGVRPSAEALSNGLISEFTLEFGRPLSSSEMERILDLTQIYTDSMILYALDEAAVYEKRSVAYVESVLAAWKKRGLSEEDVENGKR